jgi:hypothetical protein
VCMLALFQSNTKKMVFIYPFNTCKQNLIECIIRFILCKQEYTVNATVYLLFDKINAYTYLSYQIIKRVLFFNFT